MRLAETVEARYGGKQLAIIQQDRQSEQWFWYGDGINTYPNLTSMEECKEQIKKHYTKGNQ